MVPCRISPKTHIFHILHMHVPFMDRFVSIRLFLRSGQQESINKESRHHNIIITHDACFYIDVIPA
jgi:hypothetical protein